MAVLEALVALIAGRSGSLRHLEPGKVPGRTAGGEGERDRGRAIHIRIAADFGPIVGESEIGRFDDSIGDSAGAFPFGEADGFGVQAADGGVCDGRILAGDGVFHQIGDAVVVWVVVGALLVKGDGGSASE